MNAIKQTGGDSVFVLSDFADIANSEAVKKALQRLVADKFIFRLFRGVYYYPKFIPLLQENSIPNPGDVAKALARNFGWTIVPSEDAALNILGLSTQMVASWIYLSDGPYKVCIYNNHKIEFKHRTNKEITRLSYTSAIMVQALKALGQNNVTENTIKLLSKKLSPKEKQTMLSETKFVTKWIYDTIKRICEEGR